MEKNKEFKPLSTEEANELVLEYRGWAESIARCVARAWNMDWQQDGLDGAAMEALIFCSRRYEPARGVPFKSYARKRIHEASTEAARKSRGWRSGASKEDIRARDISAELLNVFPELREGQLPFDDDDSHGEDGGRGAIRQLLMGANIIAARQGLSESDAEDIVDYKRTIVTIAALEPLHQIMIWKIYWEGLSMRNIAVEWETDELNVIREHRAILEFLQKCSNKTARTKNIRVRPGLRNVEQRLTRNHTDIREFSKILAATQGNQT